VGGSWVKTITLKGDGKTSYKFSQDDDVYYNKVRVRAYKTINGKKYYGAWSSTVSIAN
jgi:hypothetical protein